MPAKKSAPKKASLTLLQKIGEQVSHVKDKLIEEKNHLAHIASETTEAIKEKIHDLRTAKNNKPAPRKKSAKKTASQPVRKSVKKTPAKKVKKVVSKKAVRKKTAKKR